jgi:hypothetical protein
MRQKNNIILKSNKFFNFLKNKNINAFNKSYLNKYKFKNSQN